MSRFSKAAALFNSVETINVALKNMAVIPGNYDPDGEYQRMARARDRMREEAICLVLDEPVVDGEPGHPGPDAEAISLLIAAAWEAHPWVVDGAARSNLGTALKPFNEGAK